MVNMNKHRAPAVYALHAGDDDYRYVGSTSANSARRLSEHVTRARSGHLAPVYQWMREVGIENVRVTDLVSIGPGDDLECIEANWIAQLLGDGLPLTNRLARDGVPNSIPAEMREKMGVSRRGVPTWITGRTGEDAGWTDERRALVRARQAALTAQRLPVHGTITEYSKYKCRCSECRHAYSGHQADYRIRTGRKAS